MSKLFRTPPRFQHHSQSLPTLVIGSLPPSLLEFPFCTFLLPCLNQLTQPSSHVMVMSQGWKPNLGERTHHLGWAKQVLPRLGHCFYRGGHWHCQTRAGRFRQAHPGLVVIMGLVKDNQAFSVKGNRLGIQREKNCSPVRKTECLSHELAVPEMTSCISVPWDSSFMPESVWVGVCPTNCLSERIADVQDVWRPTGLRCTSQPSQDLCWHHRALYQP